MAPTAPRWASLNPIGHERVGPGRAEDQLHHWLRRRAARRPSGAMPMRFAGLPSGSYASNKSPMTLDADVLL